MPINKKILSLFTLIFIASGCSFSKKSTDKVVALPTPKPEPVNLISVAKRPYVTLNPLPGRNELAITIHDLKLPANEVEVILEYDRNKGVMDAVYRTFTLDETPFTDTLFMGSKSAGGHITYHDDVIGGNLELRFTGGEEDYALRVPWRYDDQGSPYAQIATSDTTFQLSLDTPINDTKVVVMQSPGLPQNLDKQVISGPYLVRSVNQLPDTIATVSIRLPQDAHQGTIWGWDGEAYQQMDSSLEGRVLSASGPLYQLYVVTE